MAKNKRKGAKPRTVSKSERAPGPTPETLAKLAADPLWEMIHPKKGTPLVDTAGERAAEEIRAVYMAVVRGLMSRRPSVQRTDGSVPPEMPTELAEAHAQRYLPWVRETNPKVIALVIDLVVDRHPMGHWNRRICAGAIRGYARRMGAMGV